MGGAETLGMVCSPRHHLTYKIPNGPASGPVPPVGTTPVGCSLSPTALQDAALLDHVRSFFLVVKRGGCPPRASPLCRCPMHVHRLWGTSTPPPASCALCRLIPPPCPVAFCRPAGPPRGGHGVSTGKPAPSSRGPAARGSAGFPAAAAVAGIAVPVRGGPPARLRRLDATAATAAMPRPAAEPRAILLCRVPTGPGETHVTDVRRDDVPVDD